jgi:hypothetical protein
MSQNKVEQIFETLKVKNVEKALDRVYFGRKVGCMCGCNGKYNDSIPEVEKSKVIKRAMKKLTQFEANITEFDESSDYIYVEFLNTNLVKPRPQNICFYFKNK